jgi:ADP-heptose:LPS heptosyltransferase
MNDFATSNPQRIVILRALMLGDLLCAAPAFRALRCAFPTAKITLLGLPWAQEFVSRFSSYLDDFLEFPGFPGLPERNFAAEAIPGFLTEMQRRHFDWALQMHGNGSIVNPLVTLFGATRCAGFYSEGDYCPDRDAFLVYPERELEIRRHLKLMSFLGIPLQGEDLEFPLTSDDMQSLAAIPEFIALKENKYICIHPGARYASRRWSPDRFARLGDILSVQGLQIVLTGSKAEAGLTELIAKKMAASCINLAGKTSLGALGALLKGSRLVVTNDTGVSHVAAGLKTPSVIIVLGSDPARWAPLDEKRHRIVSQPVECRPCEHTKCPIGFPCAENLSVETVAGAALEMLDLSATTRRIAQVEKLKDLSPLPTRAEESDREFRDGQPLLQFQSPRREVRTFPEKTNKRKNRLPNTASSRGDYYA